MPSALGVLRDMIYHATRTDRVVPTFPPLSCGQGPDVAILAAATGRVNFSALRSRG